MEFQIKNEVLTVTVSSHGAEITSVKNAQGKEYIWCADAAFWGRHAPVLFPVVGKFKDCKYIYQGKQYEMGQHGFARDMEFVCVDQKDTEIWFELQDNEETRTKYPFAFTFRIGYRLTDNEVQVLWHVKNDSQGEKLYFSVGAHPAFVCPWAEKEDVVYKLSLKKTEDIADKHDSAKTGDVAYEYYLLNKEGLMENSSYEMKTAKGLVDLDDHFFDISAYVFQNSQLSEVSLVDPEGQAFVTVSFDAPVVGIWSPEKKHAPFVCIEPWYGRCDREDYAGTLEEREWGNTLNPGTEFKKSYRISFR